MDSRVYEACLTAPEIFNKSLAMKNMTRLAISSVTTSIQIAFEIDN